jgi:hypothetical protein
MAGRVQTAGGEVDHGFDLFPRYVVLFRDFIDRHAVFQIFEN